MPGVGDPMEKTSKPSAVTGECHRRSSRFAACHGPAYTGVSNRARAKTGVKRPSFLKVDTTNPDGERPPVTAVAATCCLRPYGRYSKLLSPHRSTPPDAFARDHDRQQVSWLAGCRFGPPSQGLVGPQWHLWSSAIRLQLRGQPRIYLSKQTDRIPLVSPSGHYRSRIWHRIATASIVESESVRRVTRRTCSMSQCRPPRTAGARLTMRSRPLS
jgi:hypothetical protein